MAQIALAMIEASLADPADWKGDVGDFLLKTLERWCGTLASDFREVFGLELVLSSAPWAHGYSDDTDWDRFYLGIYQEPNDHYGVSLDEPMAALAKMSPRFPSMFWGRFAHALRLLGLEVWDHQLAIEEEEFGWLSQQSEEAEALGEEISMPRPSQCVPEYLRKDSGTDEAMRRLLRRKGVALGTWEGELLWGALDLHQRARQVRESMREHGLHEGERSAVDCSFSWPSLVAWMRDGDQLTHLWAAMGDDLWHAGEPTPPIHVWPFEATAGDIRRVYQQLEQFASVLADAARILRVLRLDAGPLPLSVTLLDAEVRERVKVRV